MTRKQAGVVMRDGGNRGGRNRNGTVYNTVLKLFIVVCARFWLCDVLNVLGLQTLAYRTIEPHL